MCNPDEVIDGFVLVLGVLAGGIRLGANGFRVCSTKNSKRIFPAFYFSSTDASRVQEKEEMEASTCMYVD